jgi:hypothetical protein
MNVTEAYKELERGPFSMLNSNALGYLWNLLSGVATEAYERGKRDYTAGYAQEKKDQKKDRKRSKKDKRQ